MDYLAWILYLLHIYLQFCCMENVIKMQVAIAIAFVRNSNQLVNCVVFGEKSVKTSNKLDLKIIVQKLKPIKSIFVITVVWLVHRMGPLTSKYFVYASNFHFTAMCSPWGFWFWTWWATCVPRVSGRGGQRGQSGQPTGLTDSGLVNGPCGLVGPGHPHNIAWSDLASL